MNAKSLFVASVLFFAASSWADPIEVRTVFKDAYDRYLYGLKAENFELKLNGKRQQILSVTEDDSPQSVVILYDRSGSAHTDLDNQSAWLRAIFEVANPANEYALITFAETATVDVPFLEGSLAREQIIQKMESITRGRGQTALFDAAGSAIELLKTSFRKRRSVILISDGDDNKSKMSYFELKKILQFERIPVHSVCVEGTWHYGRPGSFGERHTCDEGSEDDPIAYYLAYDSGGFSDGIAYFSQVNPTAQNLANRMKSDYVVTFEPTSLKVSNKDPNPEQKVEIKFAKGGAFPKKVHGSFRYQPEIRLK